MVAALNNDRAGAMREDGHRILHEYAAEYVQEKFAEGHKSLPPQMIFIPHGCSDPHAFEGAPLELMRAWHTTGSAGRDAMAAYIGLKRRTHVVLYSSEAWSLLARRDSAAADLLRSGVEVRDIPGRQSALLVVTYDRAAQYLTLHPIERDEATGAARLRVTPWSERPRGDSFGGRMIDKAGAAARDNTDNSNHEGTN